MTRRRGRRRCPALLVRSQVRPLDEDDTRRFPDKLKSDCDAGGAGADDADIRLDHSVRGHRAARVDDVSRFTLPIVGHKPKGVDLLNDKAAAPRSARPSAMIRHLLMKDRDGAYDAGRGC